MKKSIGMTTTINIIIIFLSVAFAFIFGTISYSKAFRASSIIINAIEKHEGYNILAKKEIDKKLNNLGYARGDASSCPSSKNSSYGEGKLVTLDEEEPQEREYCIYFFNNDGDDKHYSYGIVTFMTFEFKFFNTRLKFPVYNHIRRIYRFSID